MVDVVVLEMGNGKKEDKGGGKKEKKIVKLFMLK